jgi:hypothetical protein
MQFPQAIGMAETWDIDVIRQAGEIEGYEVRFMFQYSKYKRGGLVSRARQKPYRGRLKANSSRIGTRRTNALLWKTARSR